jgi:hypothetical protein
VEALHHCTDKNLTQLEISATPVSGKQLFHDMKKLSIMHYLSLQAGHNYT